jgi:hypothetical protein
MMLKQVHPSNLKFDDTAGTVRALFAPFNVVDKQNDLTLPGAFGEQRVLIGGYGHGSWNGALPVGKGRIFDGSTGGEFEGHFFLNTRDGEETYKTVKHLGDLQEWSYSLPEIESEMRTIGGQTVRVLKRIRVNEVSPVLMGAGNGTRTLAIKGCGSCGSRCSRLSTGVCCEDVAEVLLEAEEELRKSVRITLPLQIQDLLNRSLLDEEIQHFKTFHVSSEATHVHYLSLDAARVDPELRRRAESALKSAWDRLGALWPVSIKWLEREPRYLTEMARRQGRRSWKTKAVDRPIKGLARGHGDTIFLVASALSPETVTGVVAHELRHLVQHSEMSEEVYEADARGFAHEFVGSLIS